jgi:hypothetical protein
MSVTFNCCGELNLASMFKGCCPRSKQLPKKEQIIYTDNVKQIVILSTPQIDVTEMVVFEDLANTEITMFTRDEQGAIRYIAVHGLDSFQHTSTNNASTIEIKSPDDIIGKTINEVLPEYMLRFLTPIYEQTLQGNFLQLTTMWRGGTHLLRTFPIFDHKKRVIGGQVIMSPFNNDFNGDINRFTLKPTHDQRMINPNQGPFNGPERQTIHYPHHSGILKSQITPNATDTNNTTDHRTTQSPTPTKETTPPK